jgi:hypothetical protein
MKPWLTITALCCIGCVILAPPQVKVIALFLILYMITGIALVSFLFPQEDLLDLFILALPAGCAFHIVYAYGISLIHIPFSVVSLCLPGLVLSGLMDVKGKRLHCSFDKRILIIIVSAIIFGIITLNLVPGEDANFHLLAIGDIMELKTVPTTYVLYPQISNLMYPLGFHILTAELQLLSGLDHLTFVMGSLVAAVLCVSVYWCASRLFTTEVGLIAGVLAVFATLPPLNSLIFSTYANLLAYVFTCLAIGTLAGIKKRGTWEITSFIFLSLLLAAGMETHLSFFLICIPVGLYFLQITMNPFQKKAFIVPIMALVLSLPFLIRISTGYTPYEIGKFLSLWYDPLVFTAEMIPSRIGAWITLVGFLGVFFLKEYRLLCISWIGVFLFLAVNTIIRIQIPLWYIFFATRMVDQLFLPISIGAALFLATMWKFSRGGVILVAILLMGSMTSPLIDAPRADRGLLFPTTSPFFAVDQEGMDYLQSVDEDAVILNEWWTATGSAWIPSLTRRKVIFPYIFSLEHYVDVLNIPQREREAFMVAAFPNSREAHTSLQEWDVEYIFLSSYVLDEAKWRNALWNPFLLKESPHYSLEFEKEYTYIFAVSPSNEYTTRISFSEYEFFISPGDTGIIDQLDFEMSFPVNTILELYFNDHGWTDMRVETDHGLLALVPRLNTGKEIHVAFRIPPETERVTISVEEEPIPVRAVLSTSAWDVLSYSDHIFMVGDNWECTDENYRLSDQGHIYLLHTTDTVQLTYIDIGEGNIDFNLYRNGEWEKITTIYRENDGLEKTVVLDIPPGFTLLDIGINIWGDPLLLSSLTRS